MAEFKSADRTSHALTQSEQSLHPLLPLDNSPAQDTHISTQPLNYPLTNSEQHLPQISNPRTKKDQQMPHTAQTNPQVSTDGNLSGKIEESKQKMGEQILRSTRQYLADLSRVMRDRSAEEMTEVLGENSQAEKSVDIGQFALFLHALQVASTLKPSAGSSHTPASEKSHFKLKSKCPFSFSSQATYQKKPKRYRNNGEPMAKTGRKPASHFCFLCKEVFAYKGELVHHFRTYHQLDRSQSVLYKRIKQGEEEMRRMYEL